jgi:hypothetical protein
MGNTRQIQPIQVWTPSGNKTATFLALINFFDYHFDNGTGKVEYKLISADSDLGAKDCFIGNLEIPASIIQQWGASDDIIWQYVADTLGLIII